MASFGLSGSEAHGDLRIDVRGEQAVVGCHGPRIGPVGRRWRRAQRLKPDAADASAFTTLNRARLSDGIERAPARFVTTADALGRRASATSPRSCGQVEGTAVRRARPTIDGCWRRSNQLTVVQSLRGCQPVVGRVRRDDRGKPDQRDQQQGATAFRAICLCTHGECPCPCGRPVAAANSGRNPQHGRDPRKRIPLEHVSCNAAQRQSRGRPAARSSPSPLSLVCSTMNAATLIPELAAMRAMSRFSRRGPDLHGAAQVRGSGAGGRLMRPSIVARPAGGSARGAGQLGAVPAQPSHDPPARRLRSPTSAAARRRRTPPCRPAPCCR